VNVWLARGFPKLQGAVLHVGRAAERTRVIRKDNHKEGTAGRKSLPRSK
jgi:hypothetical protein